MLRILIIAATLAFMAVLAPAADASELGQRHGGSVTVNVTPSHGQPFGFRVPRPWGFHPFGLPPIAPFLPAVALAPVLVPVSVPVAVTQPVAVPVAVPQYAPALPVSSCGCPTSP